MTAGISVSGRDLDRLHALLAHNACARCGGGNLPIHWLNDRWVAWCTTCHSEPDLAHDFPALDRYRRGDALTPAEQTTVERMLLHLSRRHGLTTQALTLQGEPSELRLKLKAKWPKDLKDDAAADQLVAVSRHLDLNPWMGEIVPYQGTPYVTIKGLVRKARESGSYAGLKTRAATQSERADALVGQEDHYWCAEARLTDGGLYWGWGKVSREERDEQRQGDKGMYFVHPVVHAKPAEMAEARAVHDALERAGVLHLGALPAGLVVELVNPETGEIVEPPAPVLLDNPFTTPPVISEGTVADLLSDLGAAATAPDLRRIGDALKAVMDDLTTSQRDRLGEAYTLARSRLQANAPG